MTAEPGRTLIPSAGERRAARTWLLPWATDRGWWRGPVLLAAVLALVRGVLLLVSHGPWFMNDSAEYLALTDELFVPRVRPPGVAVFWSAVFALWHSLDAVLVAQAIVGIAAGVVFYCIAREIKLGGRGALLLAAVASCSPSVLFFERVFLTESLSYFLTLVTLWLLLIALRTRSSAVWALTGLVGAINVLVRTVSLLSLVVIGVLALVMTSGSLLRRVGAMLAFGLAVAVPLSGYAFATYVDTRTVTGTGHFGLQFTDGFAYFAATAPLTDCSKPNRPPAIRARICAIDGYTDRDPDTISWGAGPVNDALRSAHFIQRNADLKQLAFENVRNDPLGALKLAGGRGVRLLSTYDNEYVADGRPMATQLDALDLPSDRQGDGLESVWPRAMDVWAVARLALWLAVAVALVLAPRRWRRGGRELVAVAAPAVVTFFWLVLAVTAVARYLMPLEPVGWLAAGWLVTVIWADRRAARPSESPTVESELEAVPS